jgi:hypothetical protein|tara:strand:- start:3651 stop:3800 length:150 start_codon:yes stop_codon:yes gene_type:complete
MYLKVCNEGWEETIFKSISYVEMYKREKQAKKLFGADNVIVSKSKADIW